MGFPVEFQVQGTDFFKKVMGLRYVKSDRLLILAKSNKLYAGFQEPQAIAWLQYGESKLKKFSPISLNCTNFLNICKHQKQLNFTGDSKLDAVASTAKFSARNIPIEDWSPDIEYLKFEAPKQTGLHKAFLKILRKVLPLAIAVDVTVKSIQIMHTNKTLMVTSLAETGSLGYVGIWQLDSKWDEYFTKENLGTWLLPIEAALAFLDEESSMFYSAGKTFVYGENYHMIFNQFGEAKPPETFLSLLDNKPELRFTLNFEKFFELLNQLPMGKTIELSYKKAKVLNIEASGYSKISVQTKIKNVKGKPGKITLNHRQLKQIIGKVKEFSGMVEWSHFIKIVCHTDVFTHHWLLGRSYDDSK